MGVLGEYLVPEPRPLSLRAICAEVAPSPLPPPPSDLGGLLTSPGQKCALMFLGTDAPRVSGWRRGILFERYGLAG